MIGRKIHASIPSIIGISVKSEAKAVFFSIGHDAAEWICYPRTLQ